MFYSTINLPAAINANAIVCTQYTLAICFGENVTDKYYRKMEKHAKHEDCNSQGNKMTECWTGFENYLHSCLYYLFYQ